MLISKRFGDTSGVFRECFGDVSGTFRVGLGDVSGTFRGDPPARSMCCYRAARPFPCSLHCINLAPSRGEVELHCALVGTIQGWNLVKF